MWIFGQVWFACLVGFVVGLLLDWVVRVRPLGRRVTELEHRLAAEARSARQDGDHGRSVFDRGPFAAENMTSDGFVTNRNRGGLLTPSGGDLATELLDQQGPAEPARGVEDFPGVARLAETWDEAEEATRAAPEPWQPVPPVNATEETTWVSAQPWEHEEPSPVPVSASSEETGTIDPDAQYLEYLRAGAEDDEAEVTQGEVAPPGETTVLPQIEGYEAYESYADEYEQNNQNGHHDNHQAEDYPEGFEEFQPDEFEEPAESATPLPRRTSGENSTKFAPFQAVFEGDERQPSPGGAMTPIQEGGFQPFQKPTDVEPVAGYDAEWLGEPYEESASVNGYAPPDSTSDAGASSWFDLSETNAAHSAGEGALTQRMLPVSRPDLDHPDLLRESVFGTDRDGEYEEGDARPRSLFEPVIEADDLEDTYRAPAYEPPVEPAPDGGEFVTQEFDSPVEDDGPSDSTDDQTFLAAPPHPVRVRTGVDSPVTETIPALSDDEPPRDGDEGPFGPGSALPHPDGSPPGPGFQVKARTSSMVFHTQSSPFYERLEPQVWFRSPEDAQRAGFTSWERPRSW